MSTKFEDVKQSIVEAQLASTPKDKVVNDIMKGAADLLSANDIIKRLGITADEFQELVNLPNHYLRNTGGTFGEALYRSSRLFDSHIELINKDLEGKSTFPKPDFYILGKARWKKETFKKWLEEQHQ
ncbi:MAG: hypothetical protein E7I89_06120 [Haemophilus parainfluenzae]|jgi:hypothetical protein|nr:hypothetical protein [Haemophilus parainfluenzae]MDU4451187.1 hypothetical protein [Haemophilus parainfluenzae]MDU4497655.1 hypothetical protein [Haemophilus parainfluenzae]DAN81395.1 MAG TPA: hypothetical protein [Caudoviricetes sp.]